VLGSTLGRPLEQATNYAKVASKELSLIGTGGEFRPLKFNMQHYIGIGMCEYASTDSLHFEIQWANLKIQSSVN